MSIWNSVNRNKAVNRNTQVTKQHQIIINSKRAIGC